MEHKIRAQWRQQLHESFVQADRRDSRALAHWTLSEDQVRKAIPMYQDAGSDGKAVMLGAAHSTAFYQKRKYGHVVQWEHLVWHCTGLVGVENRPPRPLADEACRLGWPMPGESASLAAAQLRWMGCVREQVRVRLRSSCDIVLGSSVVLLRCHCLCRATAFLAVLESCVSRGIVTVKIFHPVTTSSIPNILRVRARRGGASDYQSWRGCAAKGRQRAWQCQEQNINDTDTDEQEFGRADTGVLRCYSKFEGPHEFDGRCMRSFYGTWGPPEALGDQPIMLEGICGSGGRPVASVASPLCFGAFAALRAPLWPSVASPSCGVPCQGGSEDQRARARRRPKPTKDRVLHS